MQTINSNGSIGDDADVGVRIAQTNFFVPEKSLLILNCRPLERECLAKALVGRQLGLDVLEYGSIEEWNSVKDRHPPLAAVLYNLADRKLSEVEEYRNILKLVAQLGNAALVVLADSDDLVQILKAMEIGARGYILTTVDTGVCAEAIKLAIAGGIFIPASSVRAVRHLIETSGGRDLSDMFTMRQTEVVNALRKGKANKIIAYELEMRESTVKVHIRNIMRKLNATNRTEIVYKINDIYPADKSAIGAGS